MPAVSVIVPVFDPGERIGRCVDSLLAQTLRDVELIFVDDGSTDSTPAALDALAARHPRVRVEHLPHSGWPGRPRNAGLDLARGDHVFFADDDDWLEPDALERLHATALADDADIVVGKVVGHGRSSARRLFAEDLHGVRFADHALRLLELPTVHKLFRRTFLERHRLRFPEGPRRLEDHAFVVAAYFRAERISVLADPPAYHWVFHDRVHNISYRPVDAGYFASVGEVLDLVERETPPGALRDRLRAHWYRDNMLAWLTGARLLNRGAHRQEEVFTAIRELALARFGPEVHAHLPFALRVRSRLLRRGSLDALRALARFEAGLAARVRWRDEQVSARLAGVEFTPSGHWVPPAALRGALSDSDLDAGAAELRGSRIGLHVARGPLEYEVRASTRVRLPRAGRGAPALSARAGERLPAGDWTLVATVDVAGFRATAEVARLGDLARGRRTPANR